jgi:hypothetical protein
LHRTTSALTTMILGAALAASAVSAQQILPSASDQRGDSAASASGSTPAPGSTSTSNPDGGPGTNTDPIVGMAATRGARYLLRNGLDYINYQEYERALKYLREAETRQKELSNSERLTLKQAIERAQRGLREAVGSQAPYALSQRTRRPGGFSPAKPDTQIAVRPSIAPTQGKEPLVRTLNREGDDQGQPIRLTGGEIASPIPSLVPASATPAPVSGEMPQPLPIAADQSAQLSGTSKLPSTTGSPEPIADKLTKIADPSPQLASDSSTLASTLPAKPELDAAAAPQADLLLPLPPMTPVGEAQTGAQKPDVPQPAATVAAVATTVEPQPQASTAPVDTNAAPPLLAGAAPAPAPSSAATEPMPAAHESVQLPPVQPNQSAQPAPVPGAIGAKPPTTVDANAVAASTPRAPESCSEQPAATPAPIRLEQPTDPGAQIPAAKPKPDAAAQPDLLSPLSPVTPVGEAQAAPQKPNMPQAATTVAAVATTAELQPQAGLTPVDTNVAPPALAGAARAPIPSSAAAEPMPAAHESVQLPPVQPNRSAQPAPVPDAIAAKPPVTVDANAIAASTPRASESVTEQPAATPAPINPEQPTNPGAKPAPPPDPPSNDLDSVPLPPLGSESDKPKNSTPRTAKDSSPTTAKPGQAPDTPPTTTSTPPSVTTSKDLPPLPQQTARESETERDDAKAKAPATQPVSPAGNVLPPASALVPDDLPPLPQGTAGNADPKTKLDPLPPGAEELPALPPDMTGNHPAGPDSISKPDPVTQPDSVQPRAPDPATPQTAGEASPAAVKTPEPAGAVETRTGPETAATTTGEEPAVAVPAPAQAEARITAPAATAPLTAPAAMGAGMSSATSSSDFFIPQRANPPSTLRPDLQRKVEEMARMQEEKLIREQARPVPDTQPPVAGAPDSITDLRTQTQTQVDISRAPSPAEARPIRAIPVPEDWVPLGRREWSAQRKYWATAATCHMPLYFQDPMLERYGHSVEQYFGPLGRYMAYPVDDHTQTTQRNQMVQPFFSVGLFAWQILTWPYALVVDPPWEAQYDLGYWRPGDKIPTDLYYQPLHGTGPPLTGRNY